MRINDAQAAIQAVVDALNAAFRAKGYDTTAEIWIGRKGTALAVICFEDKPSDWPSFTERDEDLDALVTRTFARIDALENHAAQAAWFDPYHPINQPIADAAE